MLAAMSRQSATVQVYRTSSCPFCIAAAELLDRLGVDYEEISLDRHPDRRAATSAIRPGHTTVPLVVVDGQPIGGYREVSALHERGELEPKLFGEQD